MACPGSGLQGAGLGYLHVRDGLSGLGWRIIVMLMMLNVRLWPRCMSAARDRTLPVEPSPLSIVTIRMIKWSDTRLASSAKPCCHEPCVRPGGSYHIWPCYTATYHPPV